MLLCDELLVYYMKNFPTISVIIPVYNVERYVERCLMSVIAQTYDASLIECIVVDDCGTDESISIVSRIIESYDGNICFKLVANDCNSGLSVARNTGMQYASCDYLFFLDSDDWIESDCLESLVNALMLHPDAEVIVGNTFYVKGQRKWVYEKDVPSGIINNTKLQELFFQFKIPDTVWNTLYKREIVEKYKMSFVPKLLHEDQLWSFCLYQNIDKYLFVPQITLTYEDNPVSLVNMFKKDYSREVESIIYILNHIINNFSYAHYVDNTLYIQEYLMRYFDICDKEQALLKQKKQLKEIRNKLFIRDVLCFRLVLVMFELQLFNPIRWIVSKTKWYRNHYSYISNTVRRIAYCFSPLHSQNNRTNSVIRNE